jgi:uncharacterized protein (TIGR02246 family)
MRTTLFVTLTLFLFVGCARQEPARMTPQEQETAKKEIADLVNGIFENLEKMDVEALFQSYSNSSDFILFTTDGTMADYQQIKHHHMEWFKSLSSLKVTTVKDEFRFINANVVIYPWRGTFDMNLKTGQQVKIDFAISFVFNKLDNHWKVIYQHTATVPPSQQKPH